MKPALNDADIPDLEGFDRFHDAVRRVTGRHEASRDVVLGMVGEAEHVSITAAARVVSPGR